MDEADTYKQTVLKKFNILNSKKLFSRHSAKTPHARTLRLFFGFDVNIGKIEEELVSSSYPALSISSDSETEAACHANTNKHGLYFVEIQGRIRGKEKILSILPKSLSLPSSNSHIFVPLEEWTVSYSQDSGENVETYLSDSILPSIYKKSSLLMRSILCTTPLLPLSTLLHKLSEKSHTDFFNPSHFIADEDQASPPQCTQIHSL